VEQFAAGVKEDVLLKDWESLSGKLSYPVQISGKIIQNAKEFLALDIDGKLNQEFVNAIDKERCREMFCNYQGIMMGETGQIWIGSVKNGSGQWELKVIALNGLTDQISLESVMDRVASNVGLENAIGYEKGYFGFQKDALIKLCTSESGKYEAYGIISPEYGKRGILLNNIIDGEDNWNYFDSDWSYGKKPPELIETGDYEVQFSYSREDESWSELYFDTYETGTMSVRVITQETQEKLAGAWVKAFAVAYFAADTEQIQKFLASSFERDLEVYSGDGEDVQIHAIKGLEKTEECEVGETCQVSVEFKVSEDADYYTYLTVTVAKENDGWEVYDYGLEG